MSQHLNDATCITSALTRLGRAFNHPSHFERVLQESGTRIDKVSEITMNCLRDGSELRMSDVAARLGVELSSVSRKVAKLEEAGMLQRRPDPADARASRLFLTEAGEAELQKLNDVRTELTSRVLEEWPDAERQKFCEMLEHFTDDLIAQLGVKQ